VAEQSAEWFRATSSWVWGSLAFFAAALVIVTDILAGWHPPVTVAALLFAVVCYVSVVRPRVGVQGGDLILHHMYSTQRLPLDSVDRVMVGRMFKATADGRAYVSSALSRSVRQSLLRSQRDPQKNYADFVEDRILHRAAEARELSVRGTATDRVRRSWAWPWIAVTAALVVLLVVTILL